MKKLLVGGVALLFLVACGQDRAKYVPMNGDSLTVVAHGDSLEQAEEKINHPEMDGLFDDFIYLFMQDKSLQIERIQFPLSYRKEGNVKTIQCKDWVYDPIYVEQSENTLVIDGNVIEDEECDSLLKSAIVEWIDLKEQTVKQYKFSRNNRQWWLIEIDEQKFSENADGDFYAFYSKFANDEDYQMAHVANPFYFKTFDSDNFQEIKGWVAAEQWPAYRTYLPTDKISNIIYDNQYAKSIYRTFVLSSPSTGMNCNLVFKKVNNRWKLVRLEN